MESFGTVLVDVGENLLSTLFKMSPSSLSNENKVSKKTTPPPPTHTHTLIYHHHHHHHHYTNKGCQYILFLCDVRNEYSFIGCELKRFSLSFAGL